MIKISKMKNSSITNTEDINIDSLNDITNVIFQNNWSPFVFENNYRNINNFRSTSILALDVDDTATMLDVAKLLKDLGYKYIITPTKSHQKEKNGIVCDRFRVILPLTESITDKETYIFTWNKALELLPFLDKACKDPARFYYKSINPDLMIKNLDGKSFSVSEALICPVVKKYVKHTQSYTDDKGRLSQSTEDFRKGITGKPGEWNIILFKAAKDYQQQGYTQDECITELSNMRNMNFSGTLDGGDLNTIDSAYRVPSKYPRRVAFPVMKNDKVDKNHPDNMLHLIKISGYSSSFNELKSEITLDKHNRALNDTDLSELSLLSRKYDLNSNKDFVLDVLTSSASKKTYHPFKRFIESQLWDKVSRLDQLFNALEFDIEIDEDEKITKEFYFKGLVKWLVGSMAMTYDYEGSQNFVLLLKGNQGIRKTTFSRLLGCRPLDIYKEGSISPTNKDDVIALTQNCFMAIEEIDSITQKSKSADLKAYLTTSEVNCRAPYARLATRGIARCSFIASTNSEQFLRDNSGSRRFFILPLKSIDMSLLEDAGFIQQLYAEAKALYDSGMQHWLNPEEMKIQEKNNGRFDGGSLEKTLISKLRVSDSTLPKHWLTLDEILVKLHLDNDHNYQSPKFRGDFGTLMQKLGFSTKRVQKNRVKLTVYNVTVDIPETNQGEF